ncbi:beta-1,3-glucanase family protein [Sphaerisporangium sp. NPDC088356]|uniref:beta-1,3-glucanase family protein n=1 Tax=Sphaerisporangium sp. NPDC088356 TaxID=3154871 RepID=UPI00341C9D45
MPLMSPPSRSMIQRGRPAPLANYYLAAPANYYAKFWHDHAINHLAYGFPYDDYAGQSSFVSHGNPQWLLVAVGW